MKDGLGAPESDGKEEEERLDCFESRLWCVWGTIEISKETQANRRRLLTMVPGGYPVSLDGPGEPMETSDGSQNSEMVLLNAGYRQLVWEVVRGPHDYVYVESARLQRLLRRTTAHDHGWFQIGIELLQPG